MEEIYILRHGEAEDINDTLTKNDFDRRLVEEGKTKTKNISLLFNKLEKEVDIVLSSPYLRAKETAEVFVTNLNTSCTLKTVDFLACGASCNEIAKALQPFSSYKKVLLVGHAPDLELFLGKLIGSKRIKLKKSALAKVILNNTIEISGELEWLVTPKIANKLSKV